MTNLMIIDVILFIIRVLDFYFIKAGFIAGTISFLLIPTNLRILIKSSICWGTILKFKWEVEEEVLDRVLGQEEGGDLTRNPGGDDQLVDARIDGYKYKYKYNYKYKQRGKDGDWGRNENK